MMEMNNLEGDHYGDIERGVVEDINGMKVNNSMNALTIMLRLRQFTSSIKIPYVKEMIKNVLEQGEKIVVVDMFKETLYDLHRMYPETSGLHTGDQTVEERAELVAKFQDPNSDLRVFFASIQTANYGLTLTEASKMIIITLPFSVGQYDQVADRLHRIGQKDTVNIYPFIFMDTLDQYVFDVIESKRKEIVKALDNEDYESDISESVLTDVINKLKNKYK
jgi:SWI/SNF-related matrix-associated actin-dependent regulator 1 of chromatin subfamily A